MEGFVRICLHAHAWYLHKLTLVNPFVPKAIDQKIFMEKSIEISLKTKSCTHMGVEAYTIIRWKQELCTQLSQCTNERSDIRRIPMDAFFI